MTETSHAQLDRIERTLAVAGETLGQINERLARLEERLDGQAAEIDALKGRLDNHGRRLHDLEVKQEVADTRAQHTSRRSDGRWGALGSVGLVLLGSGTTLIGYLIVNLMK